MNGLHYTKKEINSTFKIKVSGVNFQGNRIHQLVGVSGLVELIGSDLANKLLRRAFRACINQDKEECKLRRGLKITFYNY